MNKEDGTDEINKSFKEGIHPHWRYQVQVRRAACGRFLLLSTEEILEKVQFSESLHYH